MRRGEGILLALVLGVGLLVLSPAAPAAACSCAPERRVSERSIAEYDAAFTGTVTATQVRDGRRIEVDVDEVWTGPARATTVVVSPEGGSACGVDPDIGTEGLFLASRGPNPSDLDSGDVVLAVYSCGGVRPVGEAAALGPGRPPDPGHLGPPIVDVRLRRWVAFGGLVAAAGLAAAVVVGHRRARAGGGS